MAKKPEIMGFHASSHLDDEPETVGTVKDFQDLFLDSINRYLKSQGSEVLLPKEKFDFFVGQYYKRIEKIFVK